MVPPFSKYEIRRFVRYPTSCRFLAKYTYIILIYTQWVKKGIVSLYCKSEVEKGTASFYVNFEAFGPFEHIDLNKYSVKPTI